MLLKTYLAKGRSVPPRKPTGEETNWLPVGRLTVESGKLWIGDPGFSWAECRSDQGCVAKVPKGVYVVEAKARKFGQARLVTRVRAHLNDAKQVKLGKVVGEAGTDLGQIGFCDPRAIMAAFRAAFGDDENQTLDHLTAGTRPRCGVYQPTKKHSGCLVFVPSGFGSGGAPVWGLRSGRRLIGLEMEFIPVDGD